jgi:hypothetical protein
VSVGIKNGRCILCEEVTGDIQRFKPVGSEGIKELFQLAILPLIHPGTALYSADHTV